MSRKRDPDLAPTDRDPEFRPSPMALAVEWVGRITAVALLMVMPGLAGQWADSRFGLSFLSLLGFGIGFIIGFSALLAMVKPRRPSP